MNTFKTIKEMQDWSSEQKKSGKRISFVPTMGALHEGHMSLLREGKKRGDLLVLSIYINPTQFTANEDISRYPRSLSEDLKKARECGCDAVFIPDDKMMYPKGYQTFVNVEECSKFLCGGSRPGHFKGVTTIVTKLFNIVQPDVALFGEKDFQQLIIIKKMTSELNMPIEIVGCPTVRDMDGLALSSRNQHLSKMERQTALSLSKSLDLAQHLIEKGENKASAVIVNTRSYLQTSGMIRIDYVKLVDANTLAEISQIKRPALLAIAAFIGKTRLIDNRLFV